MNQKQKPTRKFNGIKLIEVPKGLEGKAHLFVVFVIQTGCLATHLCTLAQTVEMLLAICTDPANSIFASVANSQR